MPLHIHTSLQSYDKQGTQKHQYSQMMYNNQYNQSINLMLYMVYSMIGIQKHEA